MLHRILKIEWDAVTGVLAAVIAIVLHLLHVIEAEVLSVITLVLLATMFLRSLRSEHGQRRIAAGVDRGERLLGQLARSVEPPDVVVVGPRELRRASTEFARNAKGDMVWFNVCLSMFERQPLFDALLRPAAGSSSGAGSCPRASLRFERLRIASPRGDEVLRRPAVGARRCWEPWPRNRGGQPSGVAATSGFPWRRSVAGTATLEPGRRSALL